MADDKTYTVFVRDWWRENPSWPNGLEPCAGEKEFLADGLTRNEARAMCKEYNDEHEPGRLSRKAEFMEE